MDTYVDPHPINKPKPIEDTPVNKDIVWKDGKVRSNRVAGRPPKDMANHDYAKRSALSTYNRMFKHEDKFFENIDYFLNHKNDKLRLDATLFVGEVILPSKKSLEGETRNAPITVNFVKAGYLPPDTYDAPSMGSSERPTPIQGTRMAPAGTENDNGNHGSNQASNYEEGGILAPIPNVRRS